MEFQRLRKGNPHLWNVPTVTQRSGDFSGLAASAWPKNPLTGQAFPGGIIPATRFSKNTKYPFIRLPLPEKWNRKPFLLLRNPL